MRKETELTATSMREDLPEMHPVAELKAAVLDVLTLAARTFPDVLTSESDGRPPAAGYRWPAGVGSRPRNRPRETEVALT